MKALIGRKNKTHPSCCRQKVHASAAEKTFLDSKDRVCFLLQPSIVPGAAAVVLWGEPDSSHSEDRTGRAWRRGHLPTAQERQQESENAPMWANVSMGQQEPAAICNGSAAIYRKSEVLAFKLKLNMWPQSQQNLSKLCYNSNAWRNKLNKPNVKKKTVSTKVWLFKKMFFYVLTYWCQKIMHQNVTLTHNYKEKAFSFSSITSIEKLCTEKRGMATG